MPTALLGSFDPAFLELPHEVLIAVMKHHQKNFPVEYTNAEGKSSPLQPYFIALRNGDGQGLDLVRQGNEDVIRARFVDAAFFIAEDKKHSLAEFVPKLGMLTFQKELGSMLDKTRRLVDLVSDLAPILLYSQEETRVALRAAELSKAELVTKMVVEMTSLQGVIGRYYALHSGEPQEVADAIFEQLLPRYAGETAPRTRPGLLLGLADRLDTLAGLFSVGLAPSGAKDPFALRRSALGLVQNLVAWNLDFDLREALKLASHHLPLHADPDRLADCLDFISERLRNVLLDQGYRYDVVDAVLAAQGYNPAGTMRAVKELSIWVEREDWHTILPAYARCVRITRDIAEKHKVLPDVLTESAENELYSAVKEANLAERRFGSVDDLLKAFIPMIPVINRFFDDVLVMTDDLAQRANRLGLLQMIVSMAEDEVDMSRLEGF
jgi:glycyl-tRNA synthetase